MVMSASSDGLLQSYKTSAAKKCDIIIIIIITSKSDLQPSTFLPS